MFIFINQVIFLIESDGWYRFPLGIIIKLQIDFLKNFPNLMKDKKANAYFLNLVI